MTRTSVPIHEILAFARYLSWADLQATLFEAEMRGASDPGRFETSTPHEWRWFGLMSYWYGSLNVVIEGWDQLQFSDRVIDRLLIHPVNLRSLLRRYRNGVFHYQRSLLSPKILELLQAGAVAVYWVRALHDEFIRFLAELFDQLAVTEEQKADLRGQIETVVHWYPYRQHPTIDSLKSLLKRAQQALSEHDDDRSEERRALEDTVRQMEVLLLETPKSWASLREMMLREAGIENP